MNLGYLSVIKASNQPLNLKTEHSKDDQFSSAEKDCVMIKERIELTILYLSMSSYQASQFISTQEDKGPKSALRLRISYLPCSANNFLDTSHNSAN